MLKINIFKRREGDLGNLLRYEIIKLGFTQFEGFCSVETDLYSNSDMFILHPTKKDLLLKRFESHKYPWQVRKEILFRKFKEVSNESMMIR